MALPYISTRDTQKPPQALPFDEVLLAGLAPDGGLYVPASFPAVAADQLRALKGKSYAETALAVTTPFLDGVIAPQPVAPRRRQRLC